MKICLHGLLLYLANLVGVIAGFVIFHLTAGNQLAIQIPIAAVVSILLFTFWCYLLRKIAAKKLFHAPLDLIWIFVVALVWNPAIFFSLHYFTQGYPSSWGNILAVMLFQIPINAIALCLVYYVFFIRTEYHSAQTAD